MENDGDYEALTPYVRVNILRLMKKHDITQAMLAEWCDISLATLKRYMAPSQVYSRAVHLRRIAKVLRVTVSYLQEPHKKSP